MSFNFSFRRFAMKGGDLMIRLQWIDAPAAKAAAVIGCTDSYEVKDFCQDYEIGSVARKI